MECTRKAGDSVSASLEKALITVVLFVATVLVFFATGALTKTHVSPAWLLTRWDPYIPLVPIAVWPYFSWYVSPLPLLAASRRDFRRIACAVVLAFAVSILGFIVFPAFIQRPVITGETLSERALLLLYKYDPPWNIFPSFHAALCAILWRPAFGGRLARMLMPVWMSTICVACLLTRQHHLLDIVAGLLLGFFTLAAVTAIFNHLGKAKRIGPRPEEAKSSLPVAGTGETEAAHAASVVCFQPDGAGAAPSAVRRSDPDE